MKKRGRLVALFFVMYSLSFVIQSCSTVKSYQKMKVNDSEMVLSSRSSQKFEQNFQLYREGASGGNGGKSGGGCGCN